MRTMKIKTWKIDIPEVNTEGKPLLDEKKNPIVKQVDESMIDALTVLLNNKRPEDIPRGLDNFRLMSGISKAFNKARDNGELKLEDVHYQFLKTTVKNDIPSIWGVNADLCEAIEEFMELKSED